MTVKGVGGRPKKRGPKRRTSYPNFKKEKKLRFMWRCAVCGFPANLKNISRRYNLYFFDDRVPCSLCLSKEPKLACYLMASNGTKFLARTQRARRSIYNQIKKLLKKHGCYSENNIIYALKSLNNFSRIPDIDPEYDRKYIASVYEENEAVIYEVLDAEINNFFNIEGFEEIDLKVKKMKKKSKMVQFRIPVDLYHWLRSYAKKHDKTVTSIILGYIRYIELKDKDIIEVEQI